MFFFLWNQSPLWLLTVCLCLVPVWWARALCSGSRSGWDAQLCLGWSCGRWTHTQASSSYHCSATPWGVKRRTWTLCESAAEPLFNMYVWLVVLCFTFPSTLPEEAVSGKLSPPFCRVAIWRSKINKKNIKVNECSETRNYYPSEDPSESLVFFFWTQLLDPYTVSLCTQTVARFLPKTRSTGSKGKLVAVHFIT